MAELIAAGAATAIGAAGAWALLRERAARQRRSGLLPVRAERRRR